MASSLFSNLQLLSVGVVRPIAFIDPVPVEMLSFVVVRRRLIVGSKALRLGEVFL